MKPIIYKLEMLEENTTNNTYAYIYLHIYTYIHTSYMQTHTCVYVEVQGIDPRALWILGKWCTTELHPSPSLNINIGLYVVVLLSALVSPFLTCLSLLFLYSSSSLSSSFSSFLPHPSLSSSGVLLYIYPSLALNVRSSYISLLGARITGMHHHTWIK